ncbi:hypothetical protein XI25_14085 [Paenibacillus sp. DMB20]|nr:hypothetical protein XI25_14085 [Paenibacillus sp. DMB20]
MNVQTAIAEAGMLLEFKAEDAVCLGGYHNNVYEVITDRPLVVLDFFLNFRHLYSYAYHRIFSPQDQLTPKQQEYLEKMRLSLLTDPSFFGLQLTPVIV